MAGTGVRPRDDDLVAVCLPPGPRWLDALRAAWDAGAAVLPVDARVTAAEAAAVLARARPTAVLDRDGWRRVPGGVPVASGIALVVATSGTAGEPRLVELSGAAIEAAVRASAAALQATPSDPWLACLPPAHIGGALVLFRSLVLGAPVTVTRAFSLRIFDAPGRWRFTSLVPTQVHRLLESGRDLSGFSAILVGGAALNDEAAARAARAFVPLVPTYGLTESCGGVVYAGRPLVGVEVRIGGGEVLLRGPTLMRGYRFNEERTASVLRDGWLHTGDAGELSSSGEVRVHGRMADVINTGGEKVWPAEVESALATHPEVRAVAVRGSPDPEWGERVVAYVVPYRRGASLILESLREHAAQRIARYKLPRELVEVDRLPTTAAGKVRRAQGIA